MKSSGGDGHQQRWVRASKGRVSAEVQAGEGNTRGEENEDQRGGKKGLHVNVTEGKILERSWLRLNEGEAASYSAESD